MINILIQTFGRSILAVEYNLKISISKWIFGAVQLDFLGFHISKDGIKPSSRKLQDLNNFSPPHD